MIAATTSEKLKKLHELLMQEREYAKSLAVEKMLAAAKEKQELIRTLDPPEKMNSEDRALAETIQTDNRHNAYLFWSALTWIRESMEFLGKQVTASSYNAGGYTTNGVNNGGLLSGKV
jgi:high-affinity Fe2+/Pb2+ permease